MFNSNFFASCLLYFFTFISPKQSEKTADEKSNKAREFSSNTSISLLTTATEEQQQQELIIEFFNNFGKNLKNKIQLISLWTKQELLAAFAELQELKKSIKDFEKIRQIIYENTISADLKPNEIPVFEAAFYAFTAFVDFDNALGDAIEAQPNYDQVIFDFFQQQAENADFIDEETFWDLLKEEA
jgi:hypothetical protein